MASRGGPRAAGTDGNDFGHREIIKEQYYISAQNKSRLKWSIGVHFLITLGLLVKLAPEILERLGVGAIPELDKRLDQPPKAQVWEWVWLAGFVFSFFGLTACKKSNVSRMSLFFYGTLFLCLVPVGFGMGYFAGDIYRLVK